MDNLTWSALCEKITELIAENESLKSGDIWYNECQRLMAEYPGPTLFSGQADCRSQSVKTGISIFPRLSAL